MSGLSTIEIECLARRILSNKTPNKSIVLVLDYWHPVRWLRVLARDQLPDLHHMQRPFPLVFNTDPSNKPGQHCLFIFRCNDGPLSLLIRLPCLPRITDLLLHSFIHSLISFQSYLSDLCCKYTLYLIFYRSRNILFIKINYLLKYISVLEIHAKNNIFN